MTGLKQKKWPMWAVWIGLGPICLLTILALVSVLFQSGSDIFSGSGWLVAFGFVTVATPFVFLWAAHRLNKRWQDVPTRMEIGVHGVLLLVGFVIGIAQLVSALRIRRVMAEAEIDVPFVVLPQFLLSAAIFIALAGYLAIFIGRLRLRKRTEEVFT